MKALQNPIITGVVFFSLLLVYDHHYGHLAAVAAASGGRMGGSSFRSSSRSSSGLSRTSTSSYNYRNSRSTYYSTSHNTRICSPAHQVSSVDWCIVIISTVVVIIYFLLRPDYRVSTSVLKLQVGLSGKARSLQKDFNQIAEKADTSNPKGFIYILQETTASVLQHPDYWISGCSSVEVKMGVEDCEKQFNKLSMEERGKFNEETLVNYNNIRKQSATTNEDVSNVVSNEYIVVTIIVAASGVHELPPIKSNEHLKTALQKLASISSNNILAVEVLWTPQKEDDSLTEQEMLEDYPLLHFL